MKAHRFIILALLAGTLTNLPASGGYLIDSSGAVVRNSYGECWRTGSWTPAQAIAECDPDLVRKEAPAAFFVPSPKAAPRMEALKPAPATLPSKKTKSIKKKAAKNGGGGIAALLGNGATGTAETAAPAMAMLKIVSISEHHWAPILQKGDEARRFAGFGMYTYVLFGHNPTDPDLNSAIRSRYDATLAAIRQFLLESGQGTTAAASRGATNLFCIPANQPTLDRQSYDFSLAQQYLAEFRFLLAGDKDIQPRLVSDAGPFLIATLRPLDSIVRTEGEIMKIADAKAPILFIDLTHTHTQVIAEMVDAFKREVINAKMERKKRFNPLRVALIDLLKKADDQVTPIKEAVAGFMPKEEKKRKPPPKPVSR